MLLRPILAAAVLACAGAALARPSVEVTRFHLPGGVAPGPVQPAAGVTSLERGVYDAAVMRELARLGFPTADAGARYTVSTEVTRDERPGRRRSGFSIGIGGGSFGYRSGVGVGASTSFPVGGRSSDILTRLSVQIRERATGGVVWEGRAETESSSRSRDAAPDHTAEALAAALFRDFPGESGRTMRIR